MRVVLLVVAALLVPAQAQARWLQASGNNFVVYSEDSEADLRRYAERLEFFHEALEAVTGLDLPPPSPSNRVTVFVVGDVRDVQRVAGAQGSSLAGFYISRAGGSFAFVPRGSSIESENHAFTVLRHEYAHHFLISNSSMATPTWFSEGAAEFFASARFNSDGGLSIGLFNTDRINDFRYGRGVTAEDLLDPASYQRRRRENVYDTFYAKSWLLYHYLTFSPERRGQMQAYLAALQRGLGQRAAAEGAFGDLARLDLDLQSYIRSPRMITMQFEQGQLQAGTVTIRELTPGETEIMPVVFTQKRGVTRDQAIALLGNARALAARHPGDPAVQAMLAEAEYDAGYDAEAISAADAALAIDPGQVNALVQKGLALHRQAASAPDRNAAFRAAMAPLRALNRQEPDHPMPLLYHYLSFGRRGVTPDETAEQALLRAVELAPFDTAYRMTLVDHFIASRDYTAAARELRPIMYYPHGGELAQAATAAATLMAEQPAADPQAVFAVLHARGGEGEQAAAAEGPADGGAESGAGDDGAIVDEGGPAEVQSGEA